MAVTLKDLGPGFKFYKEAIEREARSEGLDPAVVAGLIWKESDFKADAFRWEADFWNRYLKPKPQFRDLNPRRVSSSYGLMQVMYPLVFEDRLTANDSIQPEELFDVDLNLRTGCGWLAGLLAWANERTKDPTLALLAALASYNGGRGGNVPGVNIPLRNEAYARDVLHRAALLRKFYAPGG